VTHEEERGVFFLKKNRVQEERDGVCDCERSVRSISRRRYVESGTVGRRRPSALGGRLAVKDAICV